MNSLLVLVLLVLIASINAKINTTNIPENSYLFSYFDADEKAGLRIAYSTDGYIFEVVTDFLKLNILIMLLYFFILIFQSYYKNINKNINRGKKIFIIYRPLTTTSQCLPRKLEIRYYEIPAFSTDPTIYSIWFIPRVGRAKK